jgi:hypothetical protein
MGQAPYYKEICGIIRVSPSRAVLMSPKMGDVIIINMNAAKIKLLWTKIPYMAAAVLMAGCGTSRTKSPPISSSPVQVIAINFDIKRNSITGTIKNNSNRAIARVNLALDRISHGYYDGESMVEILDLKPFETRKIDSPRLATFQYKEPIELKIKAIVIPDNQTYYQSTTG